MRKYIFILILLSFFCDLTYAQKELQNQNSTFNTNQQNSNLSNFNSYNNPNFTINADATDIIGQISSPINTQLKQIPVDKSVNGDIYIVGPNDIFNLNIFGYINQSIPIIVNLEGSVVIPTIGEIKVDGLSLNKVKDIVIKAVKKRYYSSDVSFNLSTPRTFLITVSSIAQKKMEVSSINRPGDLIKYIYYDSVNVQKTAYNFNNERAFFYTEMSLRNIVLVRKDGTKINVDLYKYFTTNDDKYNPYLLEGDYLQIPYGQLNRNYITIEGAVQLGGVYEYNENDNLESAIGLTRGFDENADMDSIRIFRINPETQKFNVITLNYDNNKDFKINIFDRIFVKFKTDFVKNLSVTLLGEVLRPGVYPITFKNTTLKDLIYMAGGFKSTAFLPLSIVFRKYDEEYIKKDTNEILINMRANDLIVNEKDKDNFERDVISKRNRMVVDFEKLFLNNDLSQNIILEDKDVIYINDDKQVVYVYGQVSNEGFVPFRKGENYEYYIEKAGGYSLAADKGDTRIIKFNSRGWYKAEGTKVNSGDFIYVPKKTPAEFREYLTIVATLIGVIASVVTTYLLIKQNK